jgi:hypothetical protein
VLRLGFGMTAKQDKFGRSINVQIDRTLAVSPDGNQLFAIWREGKERVFQAKQYEKVAYKPDEIEQLANKLIAMHGKNVGRNAKWRELQPNEAMINYAKRMKIDPAGKAGEVSDKITAVIFKRAMKRYNNKMRKGAEENATDRSTGDGEAVFADGEEADPVEG